MGGIDLAYEQAGHEIIWANDNNKFACMTYRYYFSKVNLIENDIRSVVKLTIPDCDIFTASFPCQQFSVRGKQKGFSDQRGNLFLKVGKVVDAKQPKSVFLENMANLTEYDNAKTFNIIHNELARRLLYSLYHSLFF